MNQINDLFIGELYIAGDRVPSGLYREVDSGRKVRLNEDGRLPASLDDRIAAYVCVEHTWIQHQARRSTGSP
jgi:hypothetical protein